MRPPSRSRAVSTVLHEPGSLDDDFEDDFDEATSLLNANRRQHVQQEPITAVSAPPAAPPQPPGLWLPILLRLTAISWSTLLKDGVLTNFSDVNVRLIVLVGLVLVLYAATCVAVFLRIRYRADRSNSVRLHVLAVIVAIPVAVVGPSPSLSPSPSESISSHQ